MPQPWPSPSEESSGAGGVEGVYTLDKPRKNVDFTKMSREDICNTSVEDYVDTSLELLPGGKGND